MSTQGTQKKLAIDLITHLYNNYSCISTTDMAANDERLRAPYNLENPLKSFIDSLNKCADFVTA